MKEQEADGDLAAMAAAMAIVGASYVEQLDTRGRRFQHPPRGTGHDHWLLRRCSRITPGVGQPNHYALKWLDEFLYYYTTYGVRQVLNVNNGTVLVAYFLHRIGVDIEFKISVTLGNDNPYAAMWTLLTASLFTRYSLLTHRREDGSTPLVGFNWSNSVHAGTIEKGAEIRQALGLEQKVRFEHHVTETWTGLVRQPYNRREEVLALARSVPNISAKHEGGEIEVEKSRARPSEIRDYFRTKKEIETAGEWEAQTLNWADKCHSCFLTAEALTRAGLSFIAAKNLHY